MTDWVGQGTNLPADFAAVHAETNVLHISTRVLVPHAGRNSVEAQKIRAETAAQLLCRALRLAPTSYRRFELAPKDPDKPLTISVDLQLQCGLETTEPDIASASFDDAAGLAAAMQQYAAVEELSVNVSPDMASVIICRAGD